MRVYALDNEGGGRMIKRFETILLSLYLRVGMNVGIKRASFGIRKDWNEDEVVSIRNQLLLIPSGPL